MFAKTFTSERVRTCTMRNIDFEIYLGWLNDPEVTKYLTTVRNGISREDAIEYLRLMNISNEDTLFGLIDRVEGKPIGTAHVIVNWQERSCTTGFMIGDKSYWGRGYGTEIRELLSYYAFLTLYVHRIMASPDPEHIGSVKTIERNGFKKVDYTTDKFGQKVDVYELTRQMYFKAHPGLRNALPNRVYEGLGLAEANHGANNNYYNHIDKGKRDQLAHNQKQIKEE